SIRAGGRAPRRPATGPAAPPPAPAAAAAHNATVTSGAGGCRAIHHGGPTPALGICTTALLGPAAETAIMISSEDPMPARARRPGTLAPAPAGDTRVTAVGPACWPKAHAGAGHGSITDGTDQPPEQPPGKACGEGHPPEGWLMISNVPPPCRSSAWRLPPGKNSGRNES